MKEVIAIFDIGKTNKKLLLFDKHLNIVHQKEQKFEEINDDEGFACDDISRIEQWIRSSLESIMENPEFELKALNFTTYGATVMYIDAEGNRLTPLYNYLKTMPENVTTSFYTKHGGKKEFSRKTASPSMGFLNTGMQMLWMKQTRPEIFRKVKHILNFPQYCAWLAGAEPVAEHTYIGCHTATWNFDKMQYHNWLAEEGITLPEPRAVSTTFPLYGQPGGPVTGIGIHDSSASLAPYIISSPEKFILLSTGTWCITMNPYNYEPLTKEELKNGCLSYMSISGKPVKSSMLFMGHIHDVNLQRLNEYFKTADDSYKLVSPNTEIAVMIAEKGRKFFENGIPENHIDHEVDPGDFSSYEEAYHQLVMDLTLLNKQYIDMVIPENDNIKEIYISGGFARNEIYTRYLATLYPEKNIYTSEVDNATALGAAMVVYDAIGNRQNLKPDLGLQLQEPLIQQADFTRQVSE